MVLKILHVIPYFAAAYGGPVQAVRDIARMQAESGIEVEIATTTANDATELTAEERERVVTGDVPVHYFERTFPRGWFHSASLRDWLRLHAGRYDGLHLHVPFTFPMRSAVRAAQHADVPYAITPHGVFDPWSLAHKRWKKLPYLALVERTHLQKARMIHVTSAFEARGLHALGIATRVRTIPLAVNVPPRVFVPSSPEQGLRLLFVSRLHPIKDVPTLLHAVAHLKRPDVRLTIAGEGEEHYVRMLRVLAHKLGLSAVVDFIGYLDSDAKQLALQTHDVFILASLHENFSLSTIEALAAGMPAIVTDQVGVADRIAFACAGHVVPCGNPPLLAAAITDMLNETERRQMGERARALAESEFSCGVLRAAYAEFAAELSGKVQYADH